MKKSLFSLNHSGYESFDAKASNHLYVFDAEVMVDLGIANNLYRIDLFCQILQLTVASLSCYLGTHYIIEDIY